jgi:hypothetical protein
LTAAARGDEALFEGAIDDRLFDLLDGDRRLVDAEHAGGFAGRRTDAAGEFGKLLVECNWRTASRQRPR